MLWQSPEIAIVKSFGVDPRLAVFGTVVMFILMTVVVVFAKLTTATQEKFTAPILVLLWFSILITICTAASLFGSVFFRWPVDLQSWLTAKANQSRIAGEYETVPAQPSTASTTPSQAVPVTIYAVTEGTLTPAPNTILTITTEDGKHIVREVVPDRAGSDHFSLFPGNYLLSAVRGGKSLSIQVPPNGTTFTIQVLPSGDLDRVLPNKVVQTSTGQGSPNVQGGRMVK